MNYSILSGASQMDFSQVMALLKQTYWADKRSAEQVRKSMENSCCNGVYLEDEKFTQEEYSLILQCLEKKGLISLDYDKPLKNFDDSAYAAYPIRGSMALTQRGQQVVEMIQRQGVNT